jgi:hypothetical protein
MRENNDRAAAQADRAIAWIDPPSTLHLFEAASLESEDRQYPTPGQSCFQSDRCWAMVLFPAVL